MTTLSERVNKARAASLFCKAIAWDGENRPTKIITPGSDAKQYEVIIRRNGCITTQCRCCSNNCLPACKGNESSVCYHSLAALLLAAESRDRTVSFCATEDDANQLARLGGIVTFVTNHANTAKLWMVVQETKNVTDEIRKESLTPFTAEHGELSTKTFASAPVETEIITFDDENNNVGPSPVEKELPAIAALDEVERQWRDRMKAALYGEA